MPDFSIILTHKTYRVSLGLAISSPGTAVVGQITSKMRSLGGEEKGCAATFMAMLTLKLQRENRHVSRSILFLYRPKMILIENSKYSLWHHGVYCTYIYIDIHIYVYIYLFIYCDM